MEAKIYFNYIDRQITDSVKKLTVSCYGLVHGKSNHITGIFENSKTRKRQIAICYYKFLYAICYCYMLLVFAISLLLCYCYYAIMLLCYYAIRLLLNTIAILCYYHAIMML